MFFPEGQVRVHLCGQPVDMRKSYDGLYALTRNTLHRDPLSGHLFVFINRRATQSARYIGGTAAMPTRHNGKHYKSNGNNRMEQMYPNTPNSQQYNSLKYNKTENPRVGGSIPPLGTI